MSQILHEFCGFSALEAPYITGTALDDPEHGYSIRGTLKSLAPVIDHAV